MHFDVSIILVKKLNILEKNVKERFLKASCQQLDRTKTCAHFTLAKSIAKSKGFRPSSERHVTSAFQLHQQTQNDTHFHQYNLTKRRRFSY